MENLKELIIKSLRGGKTSTWRRTDIIRFVVLRNSNISPNCSFIIPPQSKYVLLQSRVVNLCLSKRLNTRFSQV